MDKLSLFVNIILITLKLIQANGEKITIDNYKWLENANNECGVSYSDRIIGGVNASLGQYPWLARIGYNKNTGLKFECGGALVNERHVITAAHCVTNLEQDVQVQSIVLGEHNILTDIDCEQDNCADPLQEFQPDKIILPTDYNTPPYKHDVAVIRLNRKAKFTEWVIPVCLPLGDNLKTDLNGLIADVAGWGLTNSDNTEGSPILQTVKLPILSMDTCKEIYGMAIKLDEEQLCVGGVMGKDSCAGDSGGPLVKAMNTPTGPKYILFGIVSFGSKRCGETPTPGIYTNVKHYILWILKNIEN